MKIHRIITVVAFDRRLHAGCTLAAPQELAARLYPDKPTNPLGEAVFALVELTNTSPRTAQCEGWYSSMRPAQKLLRQEDWWVCRDTNAPRVPAVQPACSQRAAGVQPAIKCDHCDDSMYLHPLLLDTAGTANGTSEA